MSTFKIHDHDSAPAAAIPVLDQAKSGFGMVPNLVGGLAEAPAAAEAYLTLSRLMSETSFSPTERHVVWFTINAEHGCEYCMAAHTAIAKGEKVADDVVSTARAVEPYGEARLEALRQFTLLAVRERGWVGQEAVDAFLAAGFTRQNVLEVVLGISHKVLSNYANHIVETPLDAPFQPFAWKQPAVVR